MKAFYYFTEQLIRKDCIPEEDRDIYIYGFDITIYTIWSTALLLLIGLLLRQFIPTAILVFGFYTFQTNGGGYHAKTHLRCFLTMSVGLLAGLSIVFIKDYILLWTLLGIGSLLLLLFPLVLHPNKAYLEPERKHLSSRSVIVTLSIGALAIIINVFRNEFLYAFSAAFLLAGISRIAGKTAYRNSYPTEDEC